MSGKFAPRFRTFEQEPFLFTCVFSRLFFLFEFRKKSHPKSKMVFVFRFSFFFSRIIRWIVDSDFSFVIPFRNLFSWACMCLSPTNRCTSTQQCCCYIMYGTAPGGRHVAWLPAVQPANSIIYRVLIHIYVLGGLG